MKGIDLTAPFRELVERRLWPVALLLLAGVVAVPMLLAKDAEVVAPPPGAAAAAQAATAQAAGTQPVVAVADAGATEDRRKVLGSRKDPFRPAKGPAIQKVDTGESLTASVRVTEGSGSKPESPAPSGGGGGVSTPPVSVPTAPVEAPKVYELYSLMVRFGDSTADRLPKSNLKRLKPMPDAEEPAIIYLGLLKDRKTAVFLVDAGVKVQGDGRCMPSSSSCQTVHLRAGETAFFDVTDDKGDVKAQYQLDVVKVIRKKTTDAAKAARARAATAKGGRAALRSRVSRVGKHRYDARSGVVRRGD